MSAILFGAVRHRQVPYGLVHGLYSGYEDIRKPRRRELIVVLSPFSNGVATYCRYSLEMSGCRALGLSRVAIPPLLRPDHLLDFEAVPAWLQVVIWVGATYNWL